MEDIEGFTTADCEAFYRTYYAPNNATLVIVGDIDEERALAAVQEHYGSLRAAKIPEQVSPREPAQRSERVETMAQPTQTEKVQLGYRVPEVAHPDYAALTVANEILSGGRSSRLYQVLVNETEAASEARASLTPFQEPGLFEVWVSMRSKRTAEEGLELVDRELDKLRSEPVSEAELEKAKNRIELGFLHGMETASGKAETIGFYETVLGDPSLIFERLEQSRHVTADDVLRVAKRYFDPRHRTRIMVHPHASEGKAS
jgi:zinc protease